MSGHSGSGTIFFSYCNLKCCFCQNFSLSWEGEGGPLRSHELAMAMLELQDAGCHNINLVTPSHVVPQILEALLCAVEGGLRLPLVYNTSSYDSVETLALLDGVVDIYMPDFKFWEEEKSTRYFAAPDYPEVARRAIREMHRQVGFLVMGPGFIAQRGILLRHLVMPGCETDTQEIVKWVASELGTNTYFNVMAQYRPSGLVSRQHCPEIARGVTTAEYAAAMRAAREVGLWRFDPTGETREKKQTLNSG